MLDYVLSVSKYSGSKYVRVSNMHRLFGIANQVLEQMALTRVPRRGQPVLSVKMRTNVANVIIFPITTI